MKYLNSSPNLKLSGKRTTRGSGRFALLLFLALCAAATFFLIQIFPAYLGHREMREAAETIVRRGALQHLDLQDVKAQLAEKAREAGLPENVEINLSREGRVLTARIEYSRTIYIPFRSYTWPLRIDIVDRGL